MKKPGELAAWVMDRRHLWESAQEIYGNIRGMSGIVKLRTTDYEVLGGFIQAAVRTAMLECAQVVESSGMMTPESVAAEIRTAAGQR